MRLGDLRQVMVGAAPQQAGSPPHRRRLYARLAAIYLVGSAVLVLVTLGLPPPTHNVTVVASAAAAAIALGVAVWFAPWERWPLRATLGIVPPAFALIAVGNVYGGPALYDYGVFFVVAFVWVGISQPRFTSFAIAPLAAAAYLPPLLFLPGSIWTGLSSAAVTIPLCVLVGEVIAYGVARHEQIELALQRERDRMDNLRQLHEMREAFLSAASHELRTPITICRGHLDVLSEGAAPEEVRTVRETLVDELSLMDRLVEDLATLARLDDHALLRIELVPLDNLLKSIATKAEPILGDRLRVESGMAEATVRADPQRMTQALLNLLRNAAEHARGNGPVHLRVRAGSSSWLFEVADEGGGLYPGDEQAVFEPFSTGSSPAAGSGLGLSIVRQIARAHGGESGVANRPGQGATFWLRIPR